MRWERRNSPRPWMAGLVCLVVLALATPYFCWQRPLLNVHALMAEQHAAQSARAQATQALPLRMPLEWDTLRGLCDKLEGILETAPARAIAATEPEPEAIPATAIRQIIAVEAPPAGPPLLEAVPAAPAIPAPPAPFAAVPTAPAARRTIANSPGTIIRSGVPPRVAVESSADRLAMLLPRRPLTFQSTPTPWWELDTTPEAVLSAAERDPLRLAQRHPAATRARRSRNQHQNQHPSRSPPRKPSLRTAKPRSPPNSRIRSSGGIRRRWSPCSKPSPRSPPPRRGPPPRWPMSDNSPKPRGSTPPPPPRCWPACGNWRSTAKRSRSPSPIPAFNKTGCRPPKGCTAGWESGNCCSPPTAPHPPPRPQPTISSSPC